MAFVREVTKQMSNKKLGVVMNIIFLLRQAVMPFKLLLKKMELKHLKFWTKTFLYLYTPGGYGYYRHIRQYQEDNYVQTPGMEIDWKGYPPENVQYRNYENYDEYVKHQKQKFDMILKKGESFRNCSLLGFRYLYYRRFKYLDAYLSKSASILCCGARQGTEVEVLRELGYKNAYGIDLNPGPNNKFVRIGDFMHLENADSSLDMIYCNALDHAFNLKDFFVEHARVIKLDGYVLYDISLMGESLYEAAGWSSPETVILQMLEIFKSVIKIETERNYKWILLQGKKN